MTLAVPVTVYFFLNIMRCRPSIDSQTFFPFRGLMASLLDKKAIANTNKMKQSGRNFFSPFQYVS
jgi:hypothetical protein